MCGTGSASRVGCSASKAELQGYVFVEAVDRDRPEEFDGNAAHEMPHDEAACLADDDLRSERRLYLRGKRCARERDVDELDGVRFSVRQAQHGAGCAGCDAV